MKNDKHKKVVGIGLLGLGTVGTGVVKILTSQKKEIQRKAGVRLELKKICVKSLSKKRAVKVNRRLLTDRPQDLLEDPAIDILVELIGGIHPAKEILLKALAAGKHVVTANKALLAEEGEVIFGFAEKCSKNLGFEASVCGGIPIIKSIKEGLASDSVTQILGIVNGTCNYILTLMSEDKTGFADALKQAQKKGYAEKNPRLDVEGVDSAHKLAILARLAFGSEVKFGSIFVEGIQALSAADIEYAKELGYTIKLLAIGKKMKDGLELRVHPTMLPLGHPLASVRGVYNAVLVHGERAGDLLFYGKGAGMFPTANAVVSDLIDIAKNLDMGKKAAGRSAKNLKTLKVFSIESVVSKYYLRFQVKDKPGVLGRLARTLGKHGISILSVHQKESHDPKSDDPKSVPVVILTYEASEKNLKQALKEIEKTEDTSQKTAVLRVETVKETEKV